MFMCVSVEAGKEFQESTVCTLCFLLILRDFGLKLTTIQN